MPNLLSSLSLLDFLSKQTGCQNLSDLHFLTDLQKEKLALAVQSLALTDADLFEWNDAVAYITGEADSFEITEDAVKSIIEYCTGTSQSNKEEMFGKTEIF